MSQYGDTIAIAVRNAITSGLPLGAVTAPLLNELAKVLVLSGGRDRTPVFNNTEVARHELDLAVVHYMKKQSS